MKVLLDECVDLRLQPAITGHEVRTAREMGWAARRNVELLLRAAREFDAFVTVDRFVPFQQTLLALELAVIVLRARSDKLVDLMALVPGLLEVLPIAARGVATIVEL